MQSDRLIKVSCRPPHIEFFTITGIAIGGLALWIFVETPSKDLFGTIFGLAFLVILIALTWFFGLYRPYRNCDYEITDTAIRIQRTGKTEKIIPFDTISQVRSIQRALTVWGPRLPLTYLYPDGAHDLIKERIIQCRSEQAGGCDGEKPSS